MVTVMPPEMSVVRRPSHHTTARLSLPGSTSIETVECGPITSGRLNRACAESGTSSSASMSGHSTGPLAENA